MPVIRCFPPIINARSEVLILGSMPGVRSLEAREYYAHPQNQFWKIMAKLLGHDLPLSYSRKKKMLLQNRIALWDVVSSCTRRGSLDTSMRDIRANDLDGLLRAHPRIRAVFCNGNMALKFFKKCGCAGRVPVVLLPSTSPAHTKAFVWKVRRWEEVLKVLGTKARRQR